MPKNYFTILLSTLLLVILILSAAYYFALRDIRNKITHVSELKGEIASGEEQSRYMASMEREVGVSSAQISMINNSIVPVDGNVEFIEALEALAQKNNLEITIDSLGLEDSPELTLQHMTQLKVRAKAKGGWVGTYAFLSELEGMSYKVKIERYEIQGSSDESGDPKKALQHVWDTGFEIKVLKYK